MVELDPASADPREAALDDVFGALADPTRRAILRRLTAGDASVGELAAPFEMSFAAVSKHVGVLERAGLVVRESRGRERRCHLDPRPLEAVSDWANHSRAFWNERLDALDALLRQRSAAPKTGAQARKASKRGGAHR